MGPLNPAESKELFLIAFDEFKGNISAACQAIGLARSTYYYWMEDDEEFHDKVRQLKLLSIEARLDKAEDMLDQNIDRGLSADIKFFLQSHGGQRGYGKRQTVTLEAGESFHGLSYPDEPDSVEAWEDLRDDVPQDQATPGAATSAASPEGEQNTSPVAKTVPSTSPAAPEGGPAQAARPQGEESLNQKSVAPNLAESHGVVLDIGEDHDN